LAVPKHFLMTWRIAFGILVLLAAFAPMLAAWALMLAVVPAFDPQMTTVATPNPTHVSLLGPIDLLVFAGPWFAGTIAFWLFSGCPLLSCTPL